MYTWHPLPAEHKSAAAARRLYRAGDSAGVVLGCARRLHRMAAKIAGKFRPRDPELRDELFAEAIFSAVLLVNGLKRCRLSGNVEYAPDNSLSRAKNIPAYIAETARKAMMKHYFECLKRGPRISTSTRRKGVTLPKTNGKDITTLPQAVINKSGLCVEDSEPQWLVVHDTIRRVCKTARQREIITLKVVHDCTAGEIARRLSLSTSQVNRDIQRVRARMAVELKRCGYSDRMVDTPLGVSAVPAPHFPMSNVARHESNGDGRRRPLVQTGLRTANAD